MTTMTDPQQTSSLSRQQIAELRVRCQQEPESVEIHREAVSLFLSAGLVGEAIPLLRRLAAIEPDNQETLQQLAVALIANGEPRGALDVCRRVADAQPDDLGAQHNYAVAACHAEDYPEAIIAFERELALEPGNYETLNDLAVLYSMTGRADDAARMFMRCLEANPRYSKARENAFQFFYDSKRTDEGLALAEKLLKTVGRDDDLLAWRRRLANPPAATHISGLRDREDRRPDGRTRVAGKKIGFVASSDTFLRPIAQHFAQHNEIRAFTGKSMQELADLLQWADLIWYEWCDQFVLEASRLPKRGKAVCRLHSYEAFTDMPRHVNWANIDHLILVSDTVGEILDASMKVPVPTTVIHNGVDPKTFPFVDRPQRGKRIASVGYINYKKNPSLLIQTFKAIHDWDPEFELHIAGQHQDPRIQVYMDHLLNRLKLPVTFHGWQQNMAEFYAGIDYVISTSLFESFHYSIAEGMLSGCHPLIHSWRGADRLYPNDCLFDSPDQAISLLQRYRDGDAYATARQHRDFIIERYAWEDRLDDIDRLLDGILRGETAQRPRRPRADVGAPVAQSNLDVGKVSIIIPVHNDADTIADTVESALSQTYGNIEIVISDDGSTDELAASLAPFTERVTVVRQVHRGLAAALNNGIQTSTGDYIALLLPGDRFNSETIEQQVRLLSEQQDLGAVVCASTQEQVNDPNAAMLAAAVDRCLNAGRQMGEPPAMSCVLLRRAALAQSGWFEESGAIAEDAAMLTQSLMTRLESATSVRRTDARLVELTENPQRTSADPDTRPSIQAGVAQWTEKITAMRERSHGRERPSRPSSKHAGANIVLVGASDPRAQMMMWAEALNAYTPHNVRVLTHTERNGYPSDIVLNRRGHGKPPGAKTPSLMDIMADADLIIFGAGIAPGAQRAETCLADTDEQPYGSIHWPDVLKGKTCASLLFGTPSVRKNLSWYAGQAQAKGWAILTCEPDLQRWIPNAKLLPRLLSRANERFRGGQRPTQATAIVYPGAQEPWEGGMMLRSIAPLLKEANPDVVFGRYHDLPWTEMLDLKRAAHIGIDRIAVGAGTFGMDSLENSALGLVNVVYCDPYVRAQLCAMLGTESLPWESPATEAELMDTLLALTSDTDRLHVRMNETRQWYDTWWNEERLASIVAGVIEDLL